MSYVTSDDAGNVSKMNLVVLARILCSSVKPT
jgi:hypothetical protein